MWWGLVVIYIYVSIMQSKNITGEEECFFETIIQQDVLLHPCVSLCSLYHCTLITASVCCGRVGQCVVSNIDKAAHCF